MRLTVILIVVLAASVAFADPCMTERGAVGFGSGQYEWEPLREVVLKWDQQPNLEGTAVTSEYRTTDDFWSQSADDFLCEGGHPIVALEWWGIDQTNVAIDHFLVRFFSDVPAPPFSHPGDQLYEVAVPAWTVELVPGTVEHYHYTADLPIAFEQVAGNVYWISIQAVHASDVGSQWYWCECLTDDYWNDEAVIVSDYFGIFDWTPFSTAGGVYYELAFVLYADVFSPVEESSWAGIKAMYR